MKEQSKIAITKDTTEKLHNEIWNRALEVAAIKVANSISFPTEACAVIRSLKIND